MPELTVTEVTDVGDDVLLVRATSEPVEVGVDESGEPVLETPGYEARGWVSATTNHYPASAYGRDGHLRKRARPRKMTATEVGEYARQLLVEQNPELAPSPAPLSFT